VSKKKEANLTVEYEIEVRDRDGKLIDTRKGKPRILLKSESKSLLKNFALALRLIFMGKHGESITGNVTGQDGNPATFYGSAYGYYNSTNWCEATVFSINADDDDDSYGIVVGQGTTPPTPDDYTMQSKIAHGTGSGQLDYGPHTFLDVVVNDNESSFKVSRVFTNNSGAVVNVQELGIIVYQYIYFRVSNTIKASNEIKFLILRDVLGSPVSVPDGATLTVRYTFKVST